MLASMCKQPEFLSGFVAPGSWVHYWVWNLEFARQYNVYFSGGMLKSPETSEV